MAELNKEEDIRLIVDQLKNGGIILYPTDTIWGLGCDAQNEEAVARIARLKNCKEQEGFVVLVSSMEMLQEYIDRLSPKAGNLIEFYERPLTIIYEQPRNLPASILAKDGSVAIRVTKDAFCQQFIEAFGKPVISAAANIEGTAFATTFSTIAPEIQEKVDYIAWTGRLKDFKGRSPSAIVKVSDKEELVFIRK